MCAHCVSERRRRTADREPIQRLWQRRGKEDVESIFEHGDMFWEVRVWVENLETEA